jgi:hypothetical protein
MQLSQSFPDAVPDPSKLALDPIINNVPLVCLGAAVIFALALIIYFMLRGKSQYS